MIKFTFILFFSIIFSNCSIKSNNQLLVDIEKSEFEDPYSDFKISSYLVKFDWEGKSIVMDNYNSLSLPINDKGEFNPINVQFGTKVYKTTIEGVKQVDNEETSDFTIINHLSQIINLEEYFYISDEVVIYFWASFCAPCIEAIPHLNLLNSKDNVTIIGYNPMDSQETIEAMQIEHQMNWSTLGINQTVVKLKETGFPFHMSFRDKRLHTAIYGSPKME